MKQRYRIVLLVVLSFSVSAAKSNQAAKERGEETELPDSRRGEGELAGGGMKGPEEKGHDGIRKKQYRCFPWILNPGERVAKGVSQ